MRRLLLAVLAVSATLTVLVVAAAPAGAHICPVPIEIPVGQRSTIAVGVTVENASVPDVEIDVPANLALERVDPAAGWTATRVGSSVRYRGGPIEAYTCAYFSLGVTAQGRGTFGIGVVQRAADGTVVARTTPDPKNATDRVLDQFVYAGVKPPSTGGSKRPSVGLVAGVVLVALGAVFAVVMVIRARRSTRAGTDPEERGDDGDGASASASDDDLRARLERFREQTARGQLRD